MRASDNSGAYIDQVFTVKYEKTAGDAAVLLTEGVEVRGGWKRAGWFGYFYGAFYPWVHHENLGWVYIEQNYDNTWLFEKDLDGDGPMMSFFLLSILRIEITGYIWTVIIFLRHFLITVIKNGFNLIVYIEFLLP